MIAEIGHFCLILAACLALLQVLSGFVCLYPQRLKFIALTRSSVFLQCGLVSISMLALALAFLTNDFSVSYVADNSNSTLPFIYRFCALWGAHEGSMLLWVFILSGWTAAVCYKGRSLPPATLIRVLVVLGLVSVGFYLFILLTSNPFLRLLPNFPLNGRDLNPLLQDPGLVSHPPLLYIGYVGMSVPFAFAIAALWQGQFDASWAQWARPWTTLAWCFLTIGIVLGSWWAYRELGWGGWWFWDPVENASFLPWLVATALIHSLMTTAKRNLFKSWTVLLAICAFSLSLIGTFLVRSGVLISVHAFAVDPARGAFILKFLFCVIGFSLLLYAWRGWRLTSHARLKGWSRESLLLANNILLLVAMLTVLLGTLYPLIIDILGWGKLSVGAPYFNAVFIPLMVPLLFLMGIGPLLNWSNQPPADLIKPLLIIFIVSLLAALLIPFIYWHSHYAVSLGLFLAFWLGLSVLYQHFLQRGYFIRWELRRFAVLLAHLGMSVCVIGVVLAHTYSQERDLRMHLGEQAELGPYSFQLVKVTSVAGPNYQAARATVLVKKGAQSLAVLHPEFRVYTVLQTALAKTAMVVSWRGDLYVALADPFADNSWSMRIYIKPFVRWIWLGGLLMALGGLVAVFAGRRVRRYQYGKNQ